MRIKPPVVVQECPETVPKLEWKADLMHYASNAYEAYGHDYGKISSCVYRYLKRDYSQTNWVVLAYLQEDSERRCYYSDGYSCRLCCEEEQSGKLHSLVAFATLGTTYIEKNFIARPAVDGELLSVVDQGSQVNEDLILAGLSNQYIKNRCISVTTWSKFISNVIPGTDHCVVKCHAGAIAGNYTAGHYYICDLQGSVYAYFRLKSSSC